MESLLEKAQRLGIKPAENPENPVSSSGDSAPQETMLQRAQRLGIHPPSQAQPSAFEKFAGASGKVLDPASQFLFGSTAKAVGGTIAGGIGAAEQLAGQALGKPDLQQQGQQIQQGVEKGITPWNIAMTGVELYPGGGEIGKMVSKIPIVGPAIETVGKKIPAVLKGSAEKQMTEALAPTTLKMKRTAEKVVSGMLEKGVTAFTRKGLQAKAGGMLETAGAALEKELEMIPPKTKVIVRPVLKALEDAKNDFIVAGTKIAAEPKAIQAIDGIKQVVKDVSKKGEAPFESIRSLRQIWDKTVAKAKSGKGFLMDELGNFSLEAKKTGSNAIRIELAKQFPNLNKVNKEYSFWKGVDDVITATVERTAGHGTPLGEKIATAAGIAGGLASGSLTKAVEAGMMMKSISALVNSTAWKTMSAVNKTKLANLMLSGKGEDILVLAARIGGDALRSVQEAFQPQQ